MACLKKIRIPTLMILGLLLASIQIPAANSRRWAIEVSGTMQFLAGNDLNGLVDSENSYLDLYFRENPAYQTISNPGFSKLSDILAGGLAAHYQLNSRLRLGIGLDMIHGNAENSATLVFRTNQGWRIIEDSLDYQALNTGVNLYFPYIGVGYTFPLNQRVDMEFGLQVGPVFARVRWKRRIVDAMDVVETETGFNYRLYEDERSLVMKGSDIGIGAGGGLKLRWRFSPRVGVFLETGYRMYYLPSLDGTSSLTAGGVERVWDGEWFLVEENVEREWGAADLSYPSNDPYLASRSSGTFKARIHGVPCIRLGFFFLF